MSVCCSDSGRRRTQKKQDKPSCWEPFLSLVRTRKGRELSPNSPGSARKFCLSLRVRLTLPSVRGLPALPAQERRSAGHPPCLEGAVRAPRLVAPLSSVQHCPMSLPPRRAAELEWRQEQLIFQGLGCDVTALLGTSSLHLQPGPERLPSSLSQADRGF